MVSQNQGEQRMCTRNPKQRRSIS